MRPSRRQRLIDTLLGPAAIKSGVVSVEALGIGSAGLNARGDRDEDGTHHRVILDDGTAVILREYGTTTRSSSHYMAKETAVFDVLRAGGLIAPSVLASTSDSSGPAILLADAGGQPLESLFRDLPLRARPAFWREVAITLRRLHDINITRADFLNRPIYRRPWTRFLPYFAKSLKGVAAQRPDLRDGIAAFTAMRRRLQQYLDARPVAISYGSAGYLPGMMLARNGAAWECRSWLSLGYYVSLADPDRDIVLIATAHREWTGDDLPPSFYNAYGRGPDPVAALVYEAAAQLGRGASYLRHRDNVRRAGWGPPPHSTAIASLDAFPTTVDKIRALVG